MRRPNSPGMAVFATLPGTRESTQGVDVAAGQGVRGLVITLTLGTSSAITGTADRVALLVTEPRPVGGPLEDFVASADAAHVHDIPIEGWAR